MKDYKQKFLKYKKKYEDLKKKQMGGSVRDMTNFQLKSNECNNIWRNALEVINNNKNLATESQKKLSVDGNNLQSFKQFREKTAEERTLNDELLLRIIKKSKNSYRELKDCLEFMGFTNLPDSEPSVKSKPRKPTHTPPPSPQPTTKRSTSQPSTPRKNRPSTPTQEKCNKFFSRYLNGSIKNELGPDGKLTANGMKEIFKYIKKNTSNAIIGQDYQNIFDNKDLLESCLTQNSLSLSPEAQEVFDNHYNSSGTGAGAKKSTGVITPRRAKKCLPVFKSHILDKDILKKETIATKEQILAMIYEIDDRLIKGDAIKRAFAATLSKKKNLETCFNHWKIYLSTEAQEEFDKWNPDSSQKVPASAPTSAPTTPPTPTSPSPPKKQLESQKVNLDSTDWGYVLDISRENPLKNDVSEIFVVEEDSSGFKLTGQKVGLDDLKDPTKLKLFFNDVDGVKQLLKNDYEVTVPGIIPPPLQSAKKTTIPLPATTQANDPTKTPAPETAPAPEECNKYHRMKQQKLPAGAVCQRMVLDGNKDKCEKNFVNCTTQEYLENSGTAPETAPATAPATAQETAQETAPATAQETATEECNKYHRMKQQKLPAGAVCQRMVLDGNKDKCEKNFVNCTTQEYI